MINKAQSFNRAFDKARKKQITQTFDFIDEEHSLILAQIDRAKNAKIKKVDQIPSVLQLLNDNDSFNQDETTPGIVLDSNLESITTRAAESTTLSEVQFQAKPNQFGLSSVKAGITSVVNVVMPSQRIKQKAVIQASTLDMPKLIPSLKENTDLIEETKIEDKQEQNNGIEETPVGKGIA